MRSREHPAGRVASAIARMCMPEIDRARIESRARDAYPREACGLLLGENLGESVRVVAVLPARNLCASEDGFELDPAGHLAAEREAERLGATIVGIWHSHPDRPATLSVRDLARAWCAWVYVVASVDARGRTELRAWRVRDGRAIEVWLDDSASSADRSTLLASRPRSGVGADPDRAHCRQIRNCTASVRPVVEADSGSRYQNWQ